ncbi:MAG: phosphoribosyl-ATP diphosphatase [Clostridiales bacterium]|jgi:phosphoribosyl-ATP pyrophosphohydrolase|nr:phosphoribosyl-ATP diphosphatase [Clostridiales bacterium]
MGDPLKQLYEVVVQRKNNPQEGSYTCYLFEQGLNKILKKCGEECTEVVIAAKDEIESEIENEICDLLYHLTVLMVEKEIPLENIYDILKNRSKKIGNLKKMHETDHCS